MMASGDKGSSIFGEKSIVLALLLAITLVVFNPVLMHPTWLISPGYDMIGSYTPWKYFEHISFQKFGQLPLWDNMVFSGVPLLGNMSVALFFNPFNLLFLVLPPDMVYGFIVMVHVLIAGFSTYLLLRLKRRTRLASLIGAISYMLSACIFAKLMNGSMSETMSAALLPLVFLAFENLRKGRSFVSSILLGLALAWFFHSGMIQYFFYVCIAMSLYFAYILIAEIKAEQGIGRSSAKLIYLGLIAFVICISLSAIHLLPAMELAGNTARAYFRNFDFSSVGSMPPICPITLFLPRFFGVMYNNTAWGVMGWWEMAMYIGVIGALLGLVGLFFSLKKENGAYLLIAIFMILNALGKYTPFYSLLYKYIPGFSIFRVPGGSIFIAAFCLVVFSAYGLDYLFSRENKAKSIGIAYVLLALGIISLIAVPILSSQRSYIEGRGMSMLSGSGILNSIEVKPLGYYQSKITLIVTNILEDMLRLGLLSLSLGILILLRHKTRLKPGLLGLVLLAVVLCDMLSFSMPFVWVKNPQEIFADMPLTDFLKANLSKDQGRVFDITAHGVLQHYISARYDIEIISGYDPLILSDYAKFTNLLGDYKTFAPTELTYQTDPNFTMSGLKNKVVLDLLNVKYVVSDKPFDIPGFRLVFQANQTLPLHYGGKEYTTRTTEVFVYENLARLPRAFIVRNAIVAVGDAALSRLSAPDFDPLYEVILDKDPGTPLANLGESREVPITYYSPNRIVVEVNPEGPGYLVMSEVYYPAWKAYDNGKPVEIYKADYTLRAIYLTGGPHKIEFRYEPESYKIGKIITLAAILVIAISLLIIFLFGSKKGDAKDMIFIKLKRRS